MVKNKKDEYITVTGLIEKRGWTRGMASKLLKNIDYKLVDNPYYKCATPMTLYFLKDIKRIEKTKKFKELQQKANKRKESSKKAVETKKKNIVLLADTFSITVERISLDDLRNYTLNAKQNWYNLLQSNRYYEYPLNAYSAHEEDVERWMVNYIRHNLSNYDEELEALAGKVGKSKGYWHYKERLATEMIKVYPELETAIKKYMLGIQVNEIKIDEYNNYIKEGQA